VVSDIGSRANKCKACIALSRIVGIPSGRSLPLDLGIWIRRSGCGRYPRDANDIAPASFFWDESQSSLSTPGVFLPSFSVTRRTASNLPLAERVNRCCKAFALFHLLCCTAFTIRAWSRRTSPSIVAQLRVSHFRLWPKAAPACAVIC
jgi:hypothetical protein